MSDHCHLALRQTLDLITLTDKTLQGFSRRKFTSDELFYDILGKVLGGKGRRGPAAVLVASQGPDGNCCTGSVFHLREEQLIERSEPIPIDPESSYAKSLIRAEGGSDAVPVNMESISGSEDEFQSYFPPLVLEAIGGRIHNFVSCRISGQSPGSMVAFNYPGHATGPDADVLRSAAVVIGSLLTVSKVMRETEQAFTYTIEALARACEAAEKDTGRHLVRVNRYAGALAANMGLSVEFVDEISIAAQMHDVGKIRIPVEILLKEGTLTEKEMQLIRQHPAFGLEILGDAPRLEMAREIAISHHENWDGSGYPGKLKGESIPLAGRIAKVADVYDALRSRRSYKPAVGHEETMRIFREGDERINPSHFDPSVLAALYNIEHMFDTIYNSSVPPIGTKDKDRRKKLTGR